MNKKIHWEKISVLVVVLVGVVVILLVMGKKLGYFDNFIASAPSETETLEEKKGVLPVENVYVNERYGFQMTLPKSWKKEKTVIQYVEIPQHMDDDFGYSLGYTFDTEISDLGQSLALYDIYIIPLTDWEKIDLEVVRELGRNKTFVFGVSPDNDLSATNQNGGQSVCDNPSSANQQKEFCTAYTDLKNIVSSDENLKKLHFQAFNSGIVYTNTDYDFSIEFPSSWEGYKTDAGADSVNILLPAGESGWSDTDEPSLSHYASILRLVMLPNTDEYLSGYFEDQKLACDEGPITGCLREYEIGRTVRYVVMIRLPQDIPQSAEFQKKWFDTGYSRENPLGYIDFFKKSFKTFD